MFIIRMSYFTIIIKYSESFLYNRCSMAYKFLTLFFYRIAIRSNCKLRITYPSHKDLFFKIILNYKCSGRSTKENIEVFFIVLSLLDHFLLDLRADEGDSILPFLHFVLQKFLSLTLNNVVFLGFRYELRDRNTRFSTFILIFSSPFLPHFMSILHLLIKLIKLSPVLVIDFLLFQLGFITIIVVFSLFSLFIQQV